MAAALLVAQQVAGRATRDALFLSNFDVASLPLMTAAAAVLSLVAVLAFARGMAVLTPARLLPVAVGASAGLFLAEGGLALVFPRVAAVAVYLHQAVLGAAVVSGFWSLVNERFDPYTAKRAMGAIGAGASVGGVLGGLLTWGAAALITVPAMLGLLAATGLLGLAAVRRLRVSEPTSEPSSAAPSAASLSSESRSGVDLIRGVPYLRDLALLVGLCALLETLLDYVLNAAAVQSYAKGAPLMSFFALLHGVSGLLALLIQGALVPSLLQRLGLAGTLSLQPAFAALGALVALWLPRLSSLVVLRAGQGVLRNSAFRSSYELLYTPLPTEQKRPTKVIVDVGCDRLGTVLGSAAVMLVLSLAPSVSTRAILVVAGLCAAATLALAYRFHTGYVGALAASLRSGAVTLEPAEIVDATTLLTLASIQMDRPRAGQRADVGPVPGDPLLQAAAALRSQDIVRIRRVLDEPELDPALVSHVIPLLARDEIFPLAAASLRRAAGRCTGQLVDALLDPRLEPAVRRRIPRVLHGVATQRCADGLLLGLGADRFDVRYRCGQALLRLQARNPAVMLPCEGILETAAKEADRARDGERRVEHVFTLLALVLEKEPMEIAARALRTGDGALRGTALEYLENVLPAEIRERLWPHVSGIAGASRSGRSLEEVRDDLLRSTPSLGKARPASSGG